MRRLERVLWKRFESPGKPATDPTKYHALDPRRRRSRLTLCGLRIPDPPKSPAAMIVEYGTLYDRMDPEACASCARIGHSRGYYAESKAAATVVRRFAEGTLENRT